VLTAQANAAASRAAISRAQTDLAEARRIHERNLQLVGQGFIAQSEADRTRAALASAEESLKSAQAQTGVAEAQIQSAQASVAQKAAVLAQARVDLGRTQIKSPVNGIVIKRTVERGQTVAASLQAPELFVIAQNLSDMQVDASIDEADVGRIRTGQKATFTVDAFAGQTFEGRVSVVRKAGQNVSNVVTYIAVIAFANPDGRLLPGMTANVRVVTEVRDDVLKVPNAALRMRLPGVEPVKTDESKREAEKSLNQSATGQKDVKNVVVTPLGRVFVVAADGRPVAHDVRLGLSDGSSTELLIEPGTPLAELLQPGTTVITGQPAAGTAGSTSARPSAPRLPF
jgi:HlyD family secretion protein